MPVVLADDLTGSCDVGAECLRAGWRVRVSFPWARRTGNPVEAAPGEVHVLDAETRRLERAEAVRQVGEIGWSLSRRGLHPDFFKMDSTLRGNFPSEAATLMKITGAPFAWFVPANPDQGRWTVGGRVFVGGEPLESTTYAHDPLHPIRTGDVAVLAGAAGGIGPCARLSLYQSEAASAVRAHRTQWISEGFRGAVVDAIGEDDLARFGAAVPRTDLVFGASPAARFVLGRPRRSTSGRARLGGRWLGIFGSLNPVTQAQLTAASRVAGVHVTKVGPEELFARRTPKSPRSGMAWLVSLDTRSFGRRLRGGRGALDLGNRIAEELGGLAERLAVRWGATGLVLSGGLTAAGVCARLGVEGLDLEEEISPGLVASRARWSGPELEIITKPGGFGSGESLADIMMRSRRNG